MADAEEAAGGGGADIDVFDGAGGGVGGDRGPCIHVGGALGNIGGTGVAVEPEAKAVARDGLDAEERARWRRVGNEFEVEADVGAGGGGLMNLDGNDIRAVLEETRV